MGAQGENFRLNWNDFESNLSQAFQELRNDEDFFDVTLATDEDQVGAHRVVLSACSPHLKEMLRRHGKLSGNRTNQLIYLRGVRHSDLLAVLEFMYCGSVNVSQDELNSFLAVAEDLKVKGLTHAAGKDSAETPSTKNGTGGGKRSRVPTPSTSTKKFRPDVDMKQEAEEVEVDAGEEGVEDYGDYEAETSGAVSFDEAGPSDPDATKGNEEMENLTMEIEVYCMDRVNRNYKNKDKKWSWECGICVRRFRDRIDLRCHLVCHMYKWQAPHGDQNLAEKIDMFIAKFSTIVATGDDRAPDYCCSLCNGKFLGNRYSTTKKHYIATHLAAWRYKEIQDKVRDLSLEKLGYDVNG